VALPVKRDFFRQLAAVEKTDRPLPVDEWLEPDLKTVKGQILEPLNAEGILVNRNGFRIGQDLARLGSHGAEVVAGHQGRGEHAPH